MKRLICSAVALATFSAAGCDRLPGTPRAKARELVSKVLRDPYSAKFEYVVVRDDAVCGLVNSKNGLGAYGGASPFIANLESDQVMFWDEAPSLSDYRRWSDDPESRGGLRAYYRLQTGCAFPTEWSWQCGRQWISGDVEPEVCRLWLAKDFKGLNDLAFQRR
ncbi:hypothetical protein BSP_01355 [Brevundimonas sp. Bb-A]|jgi:hypothetical protein|nr:hypothetical protein BSP_01355 [Brevundimonas sp. Bb-A]